MQVKKILLKYFYKIDRFDAILTVGKLAEKYFKEISKKPVFNVPYMTDLSKFLNVDIRLSHDGLRFLYIGRLHNVKNIKNLIKAFLEAKKKSKRRIELIIYGKGPLENYVRKFTNHNVIYKGFLTYDEIHKAYSEGDVLILPSIYDGWGRPVVEAMASGKAIICSKYVGSCNEYILHKTNGFVVGTSKEDIFKGIKYYIDNEHLINKHGILNRQIIISSEANVDIGARRLFKILKKIWDVEV